MDLSDAYSNAAHIPGGDAFPAAWAARARTFRAAHPPERLPYGEGGREWLHLHRPEGPPEGLLVLIHGGYWMAFSPSDFSWLAQGALGRGWAVALPCYPLCPEASLGGIVRAAARAVDRAAEEVRGPVVLSGHSAGGHLAARLACADVSLACRGRLLRILPVSPLSNLLLLRHTSMNASLRLSPAEAAAESPALRPRPAVPVTVWVGAAERPAFLDQATWLARAWDAPLVVEAGKHHFDVIEGFLGGALLDAALEEGAPPPAAGGGSPRDIWDQRKAGGGEACQTAPLSATMPPGRGDGVATRAALERSPRAPRRPERPDSGSAPGPHPRGSDMNAPVTTSRPAAYRFHQGERVLPFAPAEYESRLAGLRRIMAEAGIEAALLTSMHGIAYHSGFLYCSFGRPYGLVVTPTDSVTVSAGIDAGQPWRRGYGDNLTYTDWARDNFWRAVAQVAGTGKVLGVEEDHLTLAQSRKLDAFLQPRARADVAGPSMRQRMRKSPAEIDLIRAGAGVADLGGHAIREAVREGAREIDVAMAGRDAMELEIARRFPEAEYRDTWVWFQSGLNTDGAHNPVTARRLEPGDILSLNCFPMISGYYTALERTMFLRDVDPASLAVWEANVAAHEFGMSLLKPGATCAEVTHRINAFLEERDLLRFRTFGYGHSFGILSHYYGREAGLELREDVDTTFEPGMVVSMEPMLTIPDGEPGSGGYREHDILVVTEDGAENVTGYPYGPGFNVVG